MQTVTVTSVIELSNTQLEHIKKAVEKKYGKGVKVEEVVDPSIMGGIRITVESHQLDASVKTQLEAVRKQLHEYIAQGS